MKPWITRSELAHGLHGPGHLRLDRLGCIRRDLRREGPDLVRLAREHIELLTQEGRLQFGHLGEIFGAG